MAAVTEQAVNTVDACSWYSPNPCPPSVGTFDLYETFCQHSITRYTVTLNLCIDILTLAMGYQIDYA